MTERRQPTLPSFAARCRACHSVVQIFLHQVDTSGPPLARCPACYFCFRIRHEDVEEMLLLAVRRGVAAEAEAAATRGPNRAVAGERQHSPAENRTRA